MERRQTFRQRNRLRLRRDFQRVFRRRCTASDRYLVVHVGSTSSLDLKRLVG